MMNEIFKNPEAFKKMAAGLAEALHGYLSSIVDQGVANGVISEQQGDELKALSAAECDRVK
jgi:hypothetical protein